MDVTPVLESREVEEDEDENDMVMRKRLNIISNCEEQQPTQEEHQVGQQTISGHFSEEETQSTPIACLPKKKQAVWDLENNMRIVVTFDSTGQPVRDEGNELTKFLGTLVRMSQHVSIGVEDWRKISHSKKEDLWNIVKQKFSFIPVESRDIKKWVLSDMGLKWKSWKYELKTKSFDPSLTVDEIVATVTDSQVDKLQFKKLVTSWFSEESQNKRIRSKFKEPHVTGTKSFARLIDEETKRNGVRPSRATTYRQSRTRKDGSIVNAFVVEVVDKLQCISDTSSGSSTQMGVINWKNDELAKVKGREKGGRVRCLGKVVIAKGEGSCSTQDQVPILKAHINELEDERNERKTSG
ncbi:hypothetical protein OSB04_011143 [Centaurea solstitialis]|uniref:Transposase n=1 Tax=Centaurea solstitialis TaxID=347529 RepID=A0AA38T8W1_9ASTR|nr:hypothetical protein OSB04_011143 [Centaurea solstitialis]